MPHTYYQLPTRHFNFQMYGDLVVLNSLLTSWISLRRCNPDLPHPQIHVLLRTQHLTLPKLIPPLLFPISVTSNNSPKARTWWSSRNPLPHHLPHPIRYKILSIPLYSSLQSYSSISHHHSHNPGPLSLVCTVVRAFLWATAFSFLGCTLPPSSSSTSELFFRNANHSTVKALQDKNTTSYGLLLFVPFHWPLQR